MKLRLLLLNIISIITNFYSLLVRDRKKNILIFRCGGLGDFLLETVAIHRLRESFPKEQYEFFYVHRSLNSETIPLIIPVDHVIVFREESFWQIICSGVAIWKHRYSILVNMSDPRYPLMHRIIGLCNAQRKIAYDYPENLFSENEFEPFRKEYDCFVRFSWEHDHVMSMTLNLLKELTGKTFSLPEYKDYIKIHESVAGEKITIPNPYIVFSLFGSGDNHNLPDEIVNALLLYCARKFPDYMLVITGAPKDKLHTQSLIDYLSECADKLVDLCGKTSYCDLYKLAKNAVCVIGVDTGTTHFGALFSPHTFVLVRKHLPELFWPYPEKFMKNVTIITAEQCQCDTQCLQCLRKGVITPCMRCLQIEHITKSIEEIIG